jgi:RNA polymerase sigma factor (sigma-70 family)
MTKSPQGTIFSAFKTYGNRLMDFIRGRVGNDADAEDISQEVWYQLSKVVDLSEIESLSGWLFRVARNKITDNYRKKDNERLEDLAYEDDEGDIGFKEILLADESASPEMQFFKDLFWEELMKALNELPENQRNVFIGNEMEDKTLQEIADESQENLKTIISRKRYAVQHLRKRLQALYDDLNKSAE